MDVTTAIRRLQLHAAHADEDDGDVARLVVGLLERLTQDEGRAFVRHAYWRMPEVPTAALRTALGGEQALRAMAGRGPVMGACPRCTRVIRARSRDAADLGDAPMCAECRADRDRPPTRAPRFSWEFHDPPAPWQEPRISPRTAQAVRRWAEHYPDPEAA